MLINYVSLIILAKLLNPQDFGLIALSTVLIGFFEVINGFGIPQLIVKDQITDKVEIGYFFSMAMLLSLILGFLCICIGWVYAFFFNLEHSQELFHVIAISTIGILFNSYVAIYQSLYNRDLDFKMPAIYNIAALILANIIALAFATYNPSYWSLVIRNLAPCIILSTSFSFFSIYRPNFNLSLKLKRADKGFTFFLSANQALNYLARNMDYVIIGKFFDLGTVGQYSIAYRLMLAPMKMLSSRITAVLYPTLSKIKDNKSEMLNFYVKIVSYISMISFLFMGILGVTAIHWVPLVFSSTYDLLIPLIQILTIIGAFQAITSPVGILYLISDKTRLMFYYTIASSIVMILGFIAGGLSANIITFAAIYAIMSFFVNFIASNYVPLNHLDYDFKLFLKKTLSTFPIACIAYACTYFLLFYSNNLMMKFGHLPLLMEGIICFIIVYTALLRIFFKESSKEMINKIKTIYS